MSISNEYFKLNEKCTSLCNVYFRHIFFSKGDCVIS